MQNKNQSFSHIHRYICIYIYYMYCIYTHISIYTQYICIFTYSYKGVYKDLYIVYIYYNVFLYFYN